MMGASAVLEMRMDMDGLQRALEEAVKRGQNLEPPMKHWAREKRFEIREAIEAGRGMPPLSPRTIQNYQSLDRRDATFRKSGEVRASAVAKLAREGKKLAGLKDWAVKKYGEGGIPAGLQRRFDNYEKKVARINKKSAKLQEAEVVPLSQLRHHGDDVKVVIVRDQNKNRARIISPGYDGSINVAFPSDLRKVGRTFTVAASAVTKVKSGGYRIAKSGIRSRRSTIRLLGRVPDTLYGKTAKQGDHYIVVVGSRWKKDGIHNDGDGHVPKREHVSLTAGDVERLKRLITDYSLKPLRASA